MFPGPGQARAPINGRGLGRQACRGTACEETYAACPSQEKMEFRTASIRLFGHLNKVCHGDCEDVFLDQVVGGLAPLLLHLQDPQATVASVSSQGVGGMGWVASIGLGPSAASLRPAGLPCACVAPTWRVRSSQLLSRNTCRRAEPCTSGSSSTPPASTW